MKNHKFKAINKIMLLGLICLSATPTYGMMARVRTNFARIGQQLRQTTAHQYRGSLFTKPQTVAPQPRVQIPTPLTAQLAAFAPTAQPKINPQFLAPCIAAAAVIATDSTDQHGSDVPIIDTSKNDIEKLKKELATLSPEEQFDYLKKYVETNIGQGDFESLYTTITQCIDHYTTCDNDKQCKIFPILFSYWEKHYLQKNKYPAKILCKHVNYVITKSARFDYSENRYIDCFLKKISHSETPPLTSDDISFFILLARMMGKTFSIESVLDWYNPDTYKTYGLQSLKPNDRGAPIKNIIEYIDSHDEREIIFISAWRFKKDISIKLNKDLCSQGARHKSIKTLTYLLFFHFDYLPSKQIYQLKNHHRKEIINFGKKLLTLFDFKLDLSQWPDELIEDLGPEIIENENRDDFLMRITDNAEKERIIRCFYKNTYNPFAIKNVQADLLQHSFTEEQLKKPLTETLHANFSSLLPIILKYTSQKHRRNEIVLFHGQSHNWMFLQTIWQWLQSLKNNTAYNPQAIDLRFTDHSNLSDETVKKLRKEGLKKYDAAEFRADTLFTNLHIFGNLYNDTGSSTWNYITCNYDQTVTSRNAYFTTAIKDMFTELGMTEEYTTLMTQNPNLFDNLKTNFDATVKEQGNFGNLLVISMPADVAEKLVYSARPGGVLKPLILDGKETTSVVDASKHPTQLPLDNEWVIILSEEMVNPEKRKAAGIEIVGFDPVKYWQTNSYMKFEEQVEKEMVEPLRKMRAEKAHKNGEPS